MLVYSFRLITNHRAGGPLPEGPARAFGHRPLRPPSALPGTVLFASNTPGASALKKYSNFI
jgi:hypothetical protein